MRPLRKHRLESGVIFKKIQMEKFRIMLDPNKCGTKEGTAYISNEGAIIVWGAYMAMFPCVTQTMEQRNERGGIAWLSEIEGWKKSGHLPPDFDYTQYVISD